MAHPALCVHYWWRHSLDHLNEPISSSFNSLAGLPSHLGPIEPPGGPITSLGWCRRSRWQTSQVAGSRDPRGPTLGKGQPANLSMAPHGGWSRSHCRPSCLGISLDGGSLHPVGAIQSIYRLYLWHFCECHGKPGYRLKTSATTITRGHWWVVETCICIFIGLFWEGVLIWVCCNQ